jgi:hypothetical protein
MSYEITKAALITRLQTITSVADVTGFEPTSPSNVPRICVLFAGCTWGQPGQLTPRTWRFRVRVYVAIQDNEGAELLLDPLVDKIPQTLDDPPRQLGLTNVVRHNMEATDGYINIGGTECRVHEWIVPMLEKQTT